MIFRNVAIAKFLTEIRLFADVNNMNRTWNSYTMGGDPCKTVDQLNSYCSGSAGALNNGIEVGWDNEKLFVENVPILEYTMRYYDPVTGLEVNEVNRFSDSNGLGLENYPLMGDGTNGHQPYYFFLAFKEGEEFEGMSEQAALIAGQKLMSTTNDELTTTQSDYQTVYDSKLYTIIFPNPAISSFNVNTNAYPKYSSYWIFRVKCTTFSAANCTAIVSV